MNHVQQIIDAITKSDVDLALGGHHIPRSSEEIAEEIVAKVLKAHRTEVAFLRTQLDSAKKEYEILSGYRGQGEAVIFNNYLDAIENMQEALLRWSCDMWREQYDGGIEADRYSDMSSVEQWTARGSLPRGVGPHLVLVIDRVTGTL